MGVLGKERTKGSAGLPAMFRKHHPVGTTFAGKIVDAKVRQRTDDDGNLQTWADGNPQEELVIAIQTDERDPENDDDEGHRGFYIKWWGDQRRAILDALEKAGADDIEIGGSFAAKRVGQGPQPKDPRYSPPWLYEFEYRPPAALGSSLLNGSTGKTDPWGPAPLPPGAAAAVNETFPPVPAPPAAVPPPPSTVPAPPPNTPTLDPRAVQAFIAPFLAAGWTVAQLAAVPAGEMPGLPVRTPGGEPLTVAALQAIASLPA